MDEEPRLRHEFVGMMFAVTIAEVGLQLASLVQAGHASHFLPEYSHLLLVTIVIATSWVGWSLSRSPGARLDVRKIFDWEFVVLLIDVGLVIVYFILVRLVDSTGEPRNPKVAPPSNVAGWMVLVFALYLAWDIVAKVFVYFFGKQDGQRGARAPWWPHGARMIPTGICILLARSMMSQFATADRPHYLTADLALLSLVLLFRSLKDFAYAWFEAGHRTRFVKPVAWSAVWLVLMVAGMCCTKNRYQWPGFDSIAEKILAQPTTPGGAEQPARVGVPE
jgi:CDP-diglyceride synthetase